MLVTHLIKHQDTDFELPYDTNTTCYATCMVDMQLQIVLTAALRLPNQRLHHR